MSTWDKAKYDQTLAEILESLGIDASDLESAKKQATASAHEIMRSLLNSKMVERPENDVWTPPDWGVSTVEEKTIKTQPKPRQQSFMEWAVSKPSDNGRVFSTKPVRKTQPKLAKKAQTWNPFNWALNRRGNK